MAERWGTVEVMGSYSNPDIAAKLPAIVKRSELPSRAGVVDQNLNEARQLCEQRWSTARIGERFDVAGDTVRRVLRKSRITMRKPWERTE